MATAKDCHTLTSHYVKRYKERLNTEPNVNRWSARWGFDAVLGGMSMNDAKALIDYYFTTSPERRYDLDWFFYNYEKLVKAKREAEKDGDHRRKLMEESKLRAERWRQSGKQGIADSQRGPQE